MALRLSSDEAGERFRSGACAILGAAVTRGGEARMGWLSGAVTPWLMRGDVKTGWMSGGAKTWLVNSDTKTGLTSGDDRAVLSTDA